MRAHLWGGGNSGMTRLCPGGRPLGPSDSGLPQGTPSNRDPRKSAQDRCAKELFLTAQTGKCLSAH